MTQVNLRSTKFHLYLQPAKRPNPAFSLFSLYMNYSPVTTACFSIVTAEEAKSDEWKGYEVGEIKDKEFLRYIAEQNLQYGFINFYCGETSQLSSCCRLRSGTNNEYFNETIEVK